MLIVFLKIKLKQKPFHIERKLLTQSTADQYLK